MLLVFFRGEVGVSGRCIWFYWTETQSRPNETQMCSLQSSPVRTNYWDRRCCLLNSRQLEPVGQDDM